MSDAKVKCDEHHCTWIGREREILTAENPFDENDKITACPKCKTIDSLVFACDEEDCWRSVSCGTSTQSGYRRTCHEHKPEFESQAL